MKINLEQREEGVILPVRAQPRAKKEGVQGIHNGMLKVAVHAPPEDGKANEAIIAVLAKVLKVKKGQIQLQSGATSREKRFLIPEKTTDEIISILNKCS